MIRLYSIASNYLGTSNQLSGCINDQNDLIEKLQSFGKIKISKLTNNEVDLKNIHALYDESFGRWTKDKVFPLFQNSGHGTNAPDTTGKEVDGKMEGWFLSSGEVFWDYQLATYLSKFPVEARGLIIDDSCFSGGTGSTKGKQKSKFVCLSDDYDIEEARIKRRSIQRNMELNYAYWSASAEGQTSADATFKGRSNGAFTFYLLKYLNTEDTIKHIHKKISKKLPSARFSQKPQLFGNSKIYNNHLIY